MAVGPGPAGRPELVAVLWQAYLRRFDIEHVFRFLKTQLGWDKPVLRDPAAADRWTWLIIACWNQLWLARPLAAGSGCPWQRPLPPGQLTPGRVRAGFRCARAITGTPANAPKPSRPGPGRPKGSKNKHRHPASPSANATQKPKTVLKTEERLNDKSGCTQRSIIMPRL